VAHDVEAIGVAVSDDGDFVFAGEGGEEIDELAVDFADDGGFGEPFADGFGELLDGVSIRDFAVGAVG
jgi:hypothetical protein